MTNPSTEFWSTAERVLLALWVGALWTVGFVVAPVLFAELDRSTAGSLAGILFRYMNWAGLGIGGFLLARNRLAARHRTAPALLLMLISVSILVNHFGITPEISALREAGFAPASDAATRFGRLHAAASVLYLTNAAFGLVLLVIWERRTAGRGLS
jgi:hypothetical protein